MLTVMDASATRETGAYDVIAGRAAALRRATRLEVASLLYNLTEAAVGIAAGAAAGSVALIGFGLDSVVEASSAAIVLWRVGAERGGHRSAEEAERRAVRLVALAFFSLAAYVAAHSLVDLARGARPESSAVGIALAAVSVVVMPLLAWRKRLAARALDSRSLLADSRQTTLCTYLSGVLLAGLVANALLGWWWADPAAGLAVAAIALGEGLELWRTDDFCCL
jgi:divalent metal cation (Fe/Co/Zn/Cd) transporter